MKEIEFIREVLSEDMPDIFAVKEKCVEKINPEEKNRRELKKIRYACATAVIIVALVIICIFAVKPLRTFVENKRVNNEGNSSDMSDDETNASLNKEPENDIMRYSEINGAYISIEEEVTLKISAKEGEAFGDVYIFLIEENKIWELGEINSDGVCDFNVSIPGDYVIYCYSGDNMINITDEVQIEYELPYSDNETNIVPVW